MAKVATDPRDAQWFTLGDITLCQICGRAIQLRRENLRGTLGLVDVWVHFDSRMPYHGAEPKVTIWEAAYTARAFGNKVPRHIRELW